MPNSRYLTRRSLTANVTAKHYRPSSILPQNNTYLSEFYRETSADLPEFNAKYHSTRHLFALLDCIVS